MNKSRTDTPEPQLAAFEAAVRRNPLVVEVLERASELQLPNWYLGASCLTGTVWNLAHGYEPLAHIKDYDLFYFDASDLSEVAEVRQRERVKAALADLPIRVDLNNVARVHVWYAGAYGIEILPYRSTEHSIDTWPTTASAIGVYLGDDGLNVYAPLGLDDLLGLVVRPNKKYVPRRIYEEKAQRWHSHWPRLIVIDWDTGEPVSQR